MLGAPVTTSTTKETVGRNGRSNVVRETKTVQKGGGGQQGGSKSNFSINNSNKNKTNNAKGGFSIHK